MITITCDTCKQVIKQNKFACDMVVREVRQRIINGPNNEMMSRPQVEEKQVHFCEGCYNNNIKQYVGLD